MDQYVNLAPEEKERAQFTLLRKMRRDARPGVLTHQDRRMIERFPVHMSLLEDPRPAFVPAGIPRPANMADFIRRGHVKNIPTEGYGRQDGHFQHYPLELDHAGIHIPFIPVPLPVFDTLDEALTGNHLSRFQFVDAEKTSGPLGMKVTVFRKGDLAKDPLERYGPLFVCFS